MAREVPNADERNCMLLKVAQMKDPPRANLPSIGGEQAWVLVYEHIAPFGQSSCRDHQTVSQLLGEFLRQLSAKEDVLRHVQVVHVDKVVEVRQQVQGLKLIRIDRVLTL